MRIRILILILGVFVSLPVFSMGSIIGHEHLLQEGSAQITSPKDSAVIDGEARNVLIFDFHPSPSGNHLVIYLDSEAPVVVHEWRGEYTLPLLGRGSHRICIREADSSRVLTGLQKCITVIAK